jgi:hypothetical protein
MVLTTSTPPLPLPPAKGERPICASKSGEGVFVMGTRLYPPHPAPSAPTSPPAEEAGGEEKTGTNAPAPTQPGP